MFTTSTDEREAFITGLRSLADYLDTHPDVPVPDHTTRIGIHVSAIENGGREEVRQIAEALGTGIDPYSSDTHYRTDERPFGAISFYAVSISDAAMARHHALSTYTDCVTPA